MSDRIKSDEVQWNGVPISKLTAEEFAGCRAWLARNSHEENSPFNVLCDHWKEVKAAVDTETERRKTVTKAVCPNCGTSFEAAGE